MAEGNWGSAGMHKVDIRNDLMFSYVMRNPEICTELLEVLLPGHKIARVEYIELESERDGAPQAAITKARKNRPDTQKALLSAIDKRGVRLDAYLDDGKTIYNIEMQTAEYGALPQRARLYQAHIDINQLERGQNFDELRPSYVIFICTFDPFGQSRYQYSFRNVCRETGEELQDEAYKLFFNTTGTEGEISPSLREMLQYINNPGAYPVQKSKVELIHQIEINIDYILMLVKKYHDTHCEDKEVLITIRKAVDASPELRSKKQLIENFIAGINEVDDVMDEWNNYVAQRREQDLDEIIVEERLRPEDTRKFMENAFRDGEIKTTGTDIDKLLPPISRFGGTGTRAKKKQGVIDKLKTFFEKYFGIGGSASFIEPRHNMITYDLDGKESLPMVAEPKTPYGKKD